MDYPILEHGFRSDQEKDIAKILRDAKIPYEFEPYRLELNGKPYKPDFVLFGNVILEHFGVQGNADYNHRKEEKRIAYQEHGVQWIESTPADIENPQSLVDRINAKVKEVRQSTPLPQQFCSDVGMVYKWVYNKLFNRKKPCYFV